MLHKLSLDLKIKHTVYQVQYSTMSLFNKRHNTFVLEKEREFYKANDTIISKCSWPRNSKDV